MLKGFKGFIIRGNIIDLAVDVVTDPAFVAIVAVFTDSLFGPLLSTIGGAGVKGLGFEVINGNPSTYLDFVAVVTTAIDFLLVAAIVYPIVVAPMNKFSEIREARLETSAEPKVTETDLLAEIRNLLTEQNGGPKMELN